MCACTAPLFRIAQQQLVWCHPLTVVHFCRSRAVAAAFFAPLRWYISVLVILCISYRPVLAFSLAYTAHLVTLYLLGCEERRESSSWICVPRLLIIVLPRHSPFVLALLHIPLFANRAWRPFFSWHMRGHLPTTSCGLRFFLLPCRWFVSLKHHRDMCPKDTALCECELTDICARQPIAVIVSYQAEPLHLCSI